MKIDRLAEILASMDVPEARKQDWRWLLRNLGIRNANHPDFNDAIILIKAKLIP